jgi:uncharacterized protein YjbI with pentapeptide repeats/drug/metabolite transporter superfamily protein YnfA
VDSPLVGYDGCRNVREEELRVERESQTAWERALLLLRATLLPGWHPTASQGLVLAIRGAIFLGISVLIASAVDKTLWDWLDLLIIPVVLAIGGYLFTRSENRATRTSAEQRAQDEALQAYLDQIGQMLLDKEKPLRQSNEADEVRTLARARTLTVLERLDGDRKGSVARFLYESGLINRDRTTTIETAPIVNLKKADLRGAILSRTNLELANLYRADLKRANLRGAVLSQASLFRADLKEADLRGTDMRNTILYFADLEEANLLNAKVTREQLEEAKSLDRATMPDGQKYEEWLKSREEDGEGG